MLNLNINYSLEYEKQRVKSTLDDADWFIKNGYSKWVKLPGDQSLEEFDKNKSTNYLSNEVEAEYKEKEYIEVKKLIEERLPLFSSNLEKYFKETSLKRKDLYIIQLTKYGVGGSYNLPNKVIINIQIRKGKGLIKTIIHEIVHLTIERWIEKYEVDHWKKERIVDLILERIVPEINQIQKVSIDTEKIDKIFEENYPNIEEIIKSLNNKN